MLKIRQKKKKMRPHGVFQMLRSKALELHHGAVIQEKSMLPTLISLSVSRDTNTIQTYELLALPTVLQPLWLDDVLGHRHGREELDGAGHLSGDQMGHFLSAVCDLST